MKIAVGVKAGTTKNICDDTAIINERIINDNTFECSTDHIKTIAVADGVGGNSGGKEASLFVARQLLRTAFRSDSNLIREQLVQMNKELLEYASTTVDQKIMATTLTAIVCADGAYFLIHIGNTRMYVGQGAYLKQITTDHTTYQWLLSHGQLKVAESCNKNEISACLGGGNESLVQQADVREVFTEGFPNCIVLTSDGVHEYVEIDKIEEFIFSGKPDEDIIRDIINEAEKAGSNDDKTVLIVRN